MSERNLARRVGLFVFIGLVLLGVLLISFSKGSFFLRPTYTLTLHASNVGGLKGRADVLMAGYRVGYVDKTALSSDGRYVIVTLSIYKEVPIYSDAIFTIEQAGFLGDQYIAVTPRKNQGATLTNNTVVNVEAPFNFQDAAREASALLHNLTAAAEQLKASFTNVNKILLNEQTLVDLRTNLIETTVHIREASESIQRQIPPSLTNLNLMSSNALFIVKDLQTTVQSQTSSVVQVVANLKNTSSNLVLFSENLKGITTNVDQMIGTNAPALHAALKNVETATSQATNLVASIQADYDNAKGLVGGLMKDDQMKKKADQLLTSIAGASANLEVATSNLNTRGIWYMLWQHKPRKESPPEAAKQKPTVLRPPGAFDAP